jgi:hypothetical protein
VTTSSSAARAIQSRLPTGAQQPFAVQVDVHLLVRHCLTGRDVCVATGDGLKRS